MAKIVLNPAIQVISGDVSGFVYRHRADGSVVIAKAPGRSADYVPSLAQEAQMQKFRETSATPIPTLTGPLAPVFGALSKPVII